MILHAWLNMVTLSIMVDAVWQDIRIALRMLCKNAGFTTVAMLSLAIGIGVNSAVFSMINGVLLKRFPYSHAERLVGIW
jgi:putative ABC transport system permease protein